MCLPPAPHRAPRAAPGLLRLKRDLLHCQGELAQRGDGDHIQKLNSYFVTGVGPGPLSQSEQWPMKQNLLSRGNHSALKKVITKKFNFQE